MKPRSGCLPDAGPRGVPGLALGRALLALAAFALPPVARASGGAGGPAPSGLPPESLLGTWSGLANCGAESREIGLSFDRDEAGAVLVRLWLPEINAYGATLGALKFEGAGASLPDWGMRLCLRDGELTGSLSQPELLFSVRRAGTLPAEPPLPGAPGGPAPVWTLPTGPLCASPTVVGDAVVIGDTGGTVRCVGGRDGSVRWVRSLAAPVYGRIAAAGGRLVAALDSGVLVSLDAATGRDVGRIRFGPREAAHAIPTHFGDFEWDFAGPEPLVEGGVIYVAGADHALRAFDAESGELRWQFQAGERIRGGACVAGDRVVFGSRDHFVYAVDRVDGRLCWKFDTGSPVNSAPVLAGGRVVIGTRDRSRLFALDAASGRLDWSVYYWLSWVESAPALAEGTLYAGASDAQRVRAIDASTGRVIWDTRVGGWTWGTPLVAGDTVYYGAAGAPAYFVHQAPSIGALDRRTGAVRWRRPLPLAPQHYVSGVPASLVVCDGRLVAAGIDGWLCAFPID